MFFLFFLFLIFSFIFFFFSSRRRHTRCSRDWSSDVCSSDLELRDCGGSLLLARPSVSSPSTGYPVDCSASLLDRSSSETRRSHVQAVHHRPRGSFRQTGGTRGWSVRYIVMDSLAGIRSCVLPSRARLQYRSHRS